MRRYDPDWIGAILSGLLVGLSIVVATRARPREPVQRRTIVLSGMVGVALAYVIRLALRHYGI